MKASNLAKDVQIATLRDELDDLHKARAVYCRELDRVNLRMVTIQGELRNLTR